MTSQVAPRQLPRRRGNISGLRRLSRNVLIAGTAVAVVAAAGPLWAARAGVVVAVTAALVACAAAWRELAQARRTHAGEMLAASRAHGKALSDERRRNASVLDALAHRARQAAAEAARQRATIAERNGELSALQEKLSDVQDQLSGLRGELSGLQGELAGRQSENDSLRSEVRRREAVISSLRESLRAREAELTALRQDDAPRVRAIPRRVLAEHEPAQGSTPDTDELCSDGDRRRVVDLKTMDVEIMLPNYEGDRKFA